MNTETKKIGISCFIGGFICASVALAVNPIFWWMGMLAGFAGGYLAYEFRSVLRAAPVAWKSAKKGGVVVGQGINKFLREIFRKHPVWHPVAVVFCFFGYHTIMPFQSGNMVPTDSWFISVFAVTFLLLILIALIFGATMVSMLVFFGFFIEISATNKNREVYFYEEMIYDKSNRFSRAINYLDLPRWWVKGLFLATKWIICFLAWKMWYWSAIGIWRTICFFARFLKNLFILIHSNKRLLCGIDGSIGGAVAFIWLASPTMDIWSKILLCVFGGLIGAGFGILNHEVISKRVLHLPANRA